MQLSIDISIGEVSTQIHTDQSLSFDAIESLLSRSVSSVLVMFNSLSEKDRQYALGLDADSDEDIDDETDSESDA
jgi:hypothetical protein